MLRENTVTGEWVIIAPSRSKRPNEQKAKKGDEKSGTEAPKKPGRPCPFCPGNEERDLETGSWPSADTSEWVVRSVRNMFPALPPFPSPSSSSPSSAQSEPDLQEGPGGSRTYIPAYGVHEVVVTSRNHNSCPALEPVEQVAAALRLSRDRARAIAAAHPEVTCVSVFENHGPLGGASLLHPHSQIIAPAYAVPKRLADWTSRARCLGHCALCRLIEGELAGDRPRVVAMNDRFVAWVPFAAESPYNMWVAPRAHSASFMATPDEDIPLLAEVFRGALRALYFGVGDPDYNIAFVDPPLSEAKSEVMHWYITIGPHVTFPAGFELGTGMPINPSLPEDSAAFLASTLKGLSD